MCLLQVCGGALPKVPNSSWDSTGIPEIRVKPCNEKGGVSNLAFGYQFIQLYMFKFMSCDIVMSCDVM